MTRAQLAAECFKRLEQQYPEAKCSLNYTSPFELLIATILSAQTTDVGVNQVTKILFNDFPEPYMYTHEAQAQIEDIIRPIGCYKTKASRIIQTAGKIATTFGNEVPADMESLVSLPGVGRKTANVVLSNAFNIPGFAVDTHVKRVSKRIGLTDNTDPQKVEDDLCTIVAPQHWGVISHLLIYHGRAVCKARNPECNLCILTDICLKVV